MVAAKDFNAPSHPDLPEIRNLEVIKAMQSLTSRGYVKTQCASPPLPCASVGSAADRLTPHTLSLAGLSGLSSLVALLLLHPHPRGPRLPPRVVRPSLLFSFGLSASG